MASANSSSLRPAWRNSSGGRGFQPPPSVGASSDPPPQSQHQQRGGRSQSSGSLSDNADNNTNTRASGTYNKFSALDDDEDGLESSSGAQPPSSHHHHHHHHHPQSTRAGNSRSEALRHGLGSRGSGGGGTIMGGGPSKPGGRSLADLAAQAPGRFGTSSSSSRSATAAAGEEGKVIRFTREKLLSMRPVPINELPEVLQAYEGNAILSEEPLDPVCWDNFNAEEIWATVPVRRAGKPVTGGRSLSEMAEGSGGVGGPPRGPRRESASNAGRWQRGVALPPPSATDGGGSKGRKDRDSSSNVENPDDLWDDPVSGSAAGDFSAFGDLGGGGKGDGFDDTHGDDTAIFDFEKMTQASQLLEDELHGTSSNRSRASSEGSSNAGLESNHNHQRNGGTTIPAAPPVVSKAIDGKRPLATTGTTIRSGSGDDVNVFEDFDEPLSSDSTPTAVDPIPVGSTHQDDSSKKSQDEASAVEKDDLGGDVVELNKQNPEHSGSSKTDTDIDATSRLMAMIGVSSALPATEKEPNTETEPSIEAEAEKPSVVESMAVDPSQPPKPSMSSPWGDIIHGSPPTTGDQPLDGLSIPLNPWGGGSLLGPSASDLIRPQGGPSLLQQPDAAVPNEPPIKGLDLQARLREADLEQKAREQQEELARQQQRRRQEELEAQKRAAEMQQQQHQQQQQQQAAARQQQQRQEQQQGVVSQVELVLMERISIILENSWGRSDLMSILATLHAEDTRVIPLLNTMEALRALIARNPSRVALRHDPAFGAEMAVLLVTNTQWQQQQQQRQQQQQEALNRRRQEEEIRRREQQQRLIEEEQAASEALRKQQQQQQEAKFVIVPGAPWYYSDPQQNIQGPFRGEEMRQWYDAGYFKGDLPVSQDSGGPFRLLSDIYPNLDLAFTTHGTQQQQQQPQNQRNQQREEAAVAAEEEARRRAKGIDREAADLARSREMAEAEERERLDREAAAEKEKKAREAAMAERRVRPQQQSTGHNATRADDSHDTSDGGNESSAQLKMMLGLAAQQQQKQLQKQEQQPLHSNAPKPRDVPPAPKRASNKGANKKASASKVAHQAAGGAPAPTIHDLSLQQQQNVSQAPKPAASAWGVASNPQPTSRKSMSEIQQEEARMAALQTQRERSGISAPSSGWANVAASKGSSSGPTGSWSGSATAKLAPTMVLANKEMGMPKPTQVLRKQSAPSATTRAQVSNVAAINAASAKQQHGAQQPAAATSGDEFGAKMSPALEKWCKEQMVKLNGTDDLTLVSFCMTLNDPNEIRQYLVTYLGSSPQVNNFANEFIHHKVGVKPVKAEEWETTVSSKKKGKKKTTTAGGR